MGTEVYVKVSAYMCDKSLPNPKKSRYNKQSNGGYLFYEVVFR